MKNPLRLVAALLALCVTITLLPPAASAAGTVHTVPNLEDPEALINSGAVSDGDTIRIENSGNIQHKLDTPWYIGKSVTIEGGTIEIGAGGIVLGADVTFRNVALSFKTSVRNAIVANGYTLTLENVTCSNHSFNLFCGSLIDSNSEGLTVPAPGPGGTIIIRGNTTIQGTDSYGSGNIYAGNLSMGGMDGEHNGPEDNAPPNVYSGDASIRIEGSAGGDALGTVYACGAQQRIPVGQQGGKITRDNPRDYTVSGSVTITGEVPGVYGAGSAKTEVVFRGDGNQAARTYVDLSSLSVETGNLFLEEGSRFRDEKALSLAAGARLNLSAFEALTGFPAVGDFTGGGLVILGEGQTWAISGAVSGETAVAIGGVNYTETESTGLPRAGHSYLQAPNSGGSAFRLLPYPTQPDSQLVRGEDGRWTVSGGSAGTALVRSFRFETGELTFDPDSGSEAEFPLEVTSSTGAPLYLDVIPLTVTINGRDANRSEAQDEAGEPYYVYTDRYGYLKKLYVYANTLYVEPDAEYGSEESPYTIQLSVPGTYTESGKALQQSVQLTVTSVADMPEPDSVRLNTAGCKTDYQVGEPLDVTGLILEAVYSDQSVREIPVTAAMVSGFDSSRETERQTLTVTYRGKTAVYTIRITAAETPPPAHDHVWQSSWDSDASGHWHSCGAPDCPITEPSGKDGFAAHTPGNWIVDQAATATQSGSRHQACTVCGYVTRQETIPATGGGSSAGDDDDDDGDDTGGSGSGGSGQRPPSQTTTSTVTDRNTGAVTETTRRPDGSQTVVETRKDGTVTTTETAADGSTTETVQTPDGTSEIHVRQANGVTAEAAVDTGGRTTASVQIPQALAQESWRNGETLRLPVPAAAPGTSSQRPSVITVHTGTLRPVRVEIPVKSPTPGTVAVLVRPDGGEEVIRASAVTETGLTLAVQTGAAVKLVDNSRPFADTQGHWAADAAAFVSAREIFSGKGENRFAPDETMTRAMLMTGLARLDGVDTAGGSVWYEKGMAWAAANGVSDGSAPNSQITREQLAAMLYRYAGSPAVDGRALPFHDADAVSGYARDAVCWAVENGILTGYGDSTLLPGGGTTRAQASVMLMRYANILYQ